MTEVAGLLHGPHLPAAGVPASLRFHGDYLRVAREGSTLEDVPADSIEVTVIGFNDDTLQLSWQRNGETHAVTVSDSKAHHAFLAGAPTNFARRLRGGRAKVRYHRGKWNAVVGTLGALVLLVVLAWWQSEAITGWIADRVSMKTEVRLGDHALAQLETQHEMTQEGLAATTVAEIGARLTVGSRYKYRWYLSSDKDVNAYALPGGIVVVNAGMIDAASDAEELAGVLAHEVQHIEHRHTLQQMIHAAGWAAVLAVVLGDVSATTAIVVHQLGNLRNSRQLESEADTEGMKALARAGIPLDGMPRLFKELQAKEAKKGEDVVSLLSSHPATQERIQALEQLARTLKCVCQPLKIDWSAVRASVKPMLAEAKP